jgi:hypothetical protein
MGTLEQAIAGPASGRPIAWVEGVRDALTTVQSAFDVHVRHTESRDGLFDDIVVQSPRLANAVERLRREHVELERCIEEQVKAFASPPVDLHADWIAARRHETVELLVLLARHRQRGADVVYEAYEVDIGGET